MAAIIAHALRSEAQYRITFDHFAYEPHATLAQRIADVLHAFNDGGTTEIRVDAATGSLAVYVMVPADVLPETFDKKAESLRATWRETPTDPKVWTIEQVQAAWLLMMRLRHPLAAIDPEEPRNDWAAIALALSLPAEDAERRIADLSNRRAPHVPAPAAAAPLLNEAELAAGP